MTPLFLFFKKIFTKPVEGAETGSQPERTPGKVVAGGHREAADCGVGWVRLQLVDPATDHATQGPTSGK